jgi:hypothetical protein
MSFKEREWRAAARLKNTEKPLLLDLEAHTGRQHQGEPMDRALE